MSLRMQAILNNYTGEDLRRLRDEKGIGFYEARRIIRHDLLVQAISSAEDIDDIKTILLHMITTDS